jgi:hypothetical protein
MAFAGRSSPLPFSTEYPTNKTGSKPLADDRQGASISCGFILLECGSLLLRLPSFQAPCAGFFPYTSDATIPITM